MASPRDAHVRPLRWRTAGQSSTDGLRGAHARPLRHQPAGRPGTGKNAGKDEEGRNQKIAALPTFSNRQDQYTFRSPVTASREDAIRTGDTNETTDRYASHTDHQEWAETGVRSRHVRRNRLYAGLVIVHPRCRCNLASHRTGSGESGPRVWALRSRSWASGARVRIP